MDTQLLQRYAVALAAVLREHASDPEVAALQKSLSDLLDQAIKQQIDEPCEWEDIPGTHSFDQGNLRKYDDLEEAFSAFAIELSGEQDDEILDFIQDLKDGK